MTPELSPETARLIGTLKDHPGFQALLDYLRADLVGLQEDMVAADDPCVALKYMRLWQILSRVIDIFATVPERIFITLDAEAEGETIERDPFAPPNHAYLQSLLKTNPNIPQ